MMSSATQEPLAINDREAARLLGLSRSTVRSLVKAGKIRAVRARRRLLIPVAAIHEFLESSQINPQETSTNALQQSSTQKTQMPNSRND